jgi:hypothetical protein
VTILEQCWRPGNCDVSSASSSISGYCLPTVKTKTFHRSASASLHTERLTKLPNKISIRSTFLLGLLQELASTRPSYRTQILCQFIFRHSNTRIYHISLHPPYFLCSNSPLTMIFPVFPPLPSSIFTSIVTFASPELMTSLSVRAVIRSFSSASLAFERSSRRNTSLCE